MSCGIALSLCLAGFFSSAVEAAHYKVFLLGGQSNMLGRAPSSGLPTSPVNLQEPQDDVLFYQRSTLTTLRPGSGRETTEFGPEVTFGRAIADALPADNIALIKHAVGGSNLYNHWAPASGSIYSAFRDTVTAGLAAIHAAGHTTEIVGMLWHQGESDAIDGQQASYQSNLTAFIADIRSRYGADLPFLIGEIRRSSAPFDTVADAQIAVAAADAPAVFVPASDLSFSDLYHFDAPSQVTLGQRFASSFLTITGVSINAVSSQLNADRSADYIINGNGFTEVSGFHSNAGGNGISWTSGSSTSEPLGHFITFDLGGSYDLASVKIWNWNTTNTLSVGAKDIDISVAATVGGTFIPVGSYVLNIGPGQSSVDFGQIIDLSSFSAADTVRLVRIDINSNHGWTHATLPGLAGLSEIRFSGSSVPANTFSTWISDPAFGLDSSQQGFDFDADGDGLANGLEAWFGTHPGQFNVGLTITSTDGATTILSHPEQENPPEDLTITYQWSPNLIDWFPGGSGPDGGPKVILTANTVGGIATITAEADGEVNKLFIRALVEQTPTS